MREGFRIFRSVFSETELAALREEATRIQRTEGKACVRRIRSKSEIFHDLAWSSDLMEILPQMLTPVRSILFDKTPESNWPVAWHQDLTIQVSEQTELDGYGPWSVKDDGIHVQPPIQILESMWTLRIHLDDTLADNGPLMVIPSSHTQGKLNSDESSEIGRQAPYLCECQAGDVLLMSPLILHSSNRSKKPSHRRVIHFEYAEPELLDSSLSFVDG